jgi:hypothetical protein
MQELEELEVFLADLADKEVLVVGVDKDADKVVKVEMEAQVGMEVMAAMDPQDLVSRCTKCQ